MLTFWKFEEILRDCTPSLRSDAMATQSLPTMAITEPPLYSIIDYKKAEHIAMSSKQTKLTMMSRRSEEVFSTRQSK